MYSRPLPSEKIGEGVSVGEGDDCTDSVHGLVSDGQSISSSSVKTANNKMPVSSVFNDSEGLYRTTVSVALSVGLIIPRGTVRFGSCVRASFFSQIRHRNTLTEIAREDDVQGLVMAMSTVASEKNNLELLFTGNVFYKQWHLCVLFH